MLPKIIVKTGKFTMEESLKICPQAPVKMRDVTDIAFRKSDVTAEKAEGRPRGQTKVSWQLSRCRPRTIRHTPRQGVLPQRTHPDIRSVVLGIPI